MRKKPFIRKGRLYLTRGKYQRGGGGAIPWGLIASTALLIVPKIFIGSYRKRRKRVYKKDGRAKK